MYYKHNIHSLPVARYNVVEYVGAYQIFSDEKKNKRYCDVNESCDKIMTTNSGHAHHKKFHWF
jgi:hypothetical protein